MYGAVIAFCRYLISFCVNILHQHISVLQNKSASMSGFKYIESNKVSKAQKRRDAKAAKKSEILDRIAEAEKLDEHKDRRLEQERLSDILREEHLKIYDIEADGDCLYGAIEHQLSIADDSLELLSMQDLRERTSQYMLDHPDQFMPFLLNDHGDIMNQQDYIKYCNKIAKTRVWGGHTELAAISNFIHKPIHVYQAESRSPIVVQPEQKSPFTGIDSAKRKPVLLSYHKHLYHLGEHYNSLVRNVD